MPTALINHNVAAAATRIKRSIQRQRNPRHLSSGRAQQRSNGNDNG